MFKTLKNTIISLKNYLYANRLTHATFADVKSRAIHHRDYAATKHEILYKRASCRNKKFCFVGVDVKNAYREKGVASKIVHLLTERILERDIIPIYPTWYSNIGSRKTALNAGYRPCWVELGVESIITKTP